MQFRLNLLFGGVRTLAENYVSNNNNTLIFKYEVLTMVRVCDVVSAGYATEIVKAFCFFTIFYINTPA
jgi:hypothetical protein